MTAPIPANAFSPIATPSRTTTLPERYAPFPVDELPIMSVSPTTSYDTMQFVSSKVGTICTGMAASMGAILLVAGEKGMRAALPHSRVMIHQPLGGIQGQASDIEITAREILKLKDELYQIIADHSGQTVERIRQDADRDYWMTSKEALDYGMIDLLYTRKSNGKQETQM